MIIKESKKKANGSFSNLAKYISREDKANEIKMTNLDDCHDLSDALFLIKATQEMNTRSKDDKTAHYIVSFPNDEKPSKEVLEKIEISICEALGYSDHQRISSIHSDTEHLHMHIAINKIHPHTFNIHTPFYSYKTLFKLARELEIKHDLKIINEHNLSNNSKTNLPEIKAHRGVVSFDQWLIAAPRIALLNTLNSEKTKSWEDVHKVLNEFGLRLEKKGAGHILRDDKYPERVSKASLILNVKNIEEKLGDFSKNTFDPLDNAKRYNESYLVNDMKLYNVFLDQNKKTIEIRDKAFNELRELKSARRKALHAKFKEERKSARLNKAKREVYSLIAYHKLEAFEKLELELKKIDTEVRMSLPKKTSWKEFVFDEATKGNIKAIETLQKMTSIQLSEYSSAISSEKGINGNSVLFQDVQYKIHKNGRIDYFLNKNNSVISDNGFWVKNTNEPTDKEIRFALNLAIEKFGTNLKLTGSDDYKARVVSLASEIEHLSLSFSDSGLDHQYKMLKDHSKVYSTDKKKTHYKTNELENFIKNRNEARAKIKDISEHFIFDQTKHNNQAYAYEGIRNIAGKKFVLLKKDDRIFVKEINDKQVASLKAIKKSSIVRVQDDEIKFIRTLGKGHQKGINRSGD